MLVWRLTHYNKKYNRNTKREVLIPPGFYLAEKKEGYTRQKDEHKQRMEDVDKYDEIWGG